MRYRILKHTKLDRETFSIERFVTQVDDMTIGVIQKWEHHGGPYNTLETAEDELRAVTALTRTEIVREVDSES